MTSTPKRTRKRAQGPAGGHAVTTPADASASNRQEQIACAAYYRAERRGFEPGHEIEDWLAAEREVDGRLRDPTTGALAH
ncbi:MAG: DUF2934 domain-containing protein [Gammaproteobacteria bacterium]